MTFNLPQYKSCNSDPSTPNYLANITRLISSFRAASLPVIHIHHHSTSSESPWDPITCPEGVVPMPEAAPIPGETVFIKTVNSGFIGTGLEAHLRQEKIKTLVAVGLTTIHCVSTTVRMAGNLGWEVFVPREATATFARDPAPGAPVGLGKFDAKTMYEVALAELHGEFATVVTTEEVLLAVEGVKR
ncbi:hypothetical protein C0991_006881 [Blastosporella zonata]|nr:hypothetical protein C0991_006881 [Blastosporella zonata]